MNNCGHCWQALTDYYGEHMFLSGIWTGLLLVLLFYFLLLFLRLILCPKRVKMISYAAEGGMIRIRASAVADLIRAVSADFPEFSIVKTVILGKRSKIFLRVILDYKAGDRAFHSVVSDFQKRAVNELRDSFGISNVSTVEVSMRNSKGKTMPGIPAEKENPDQSAQDELNEYISARNDL